MGQMAERLENQNPHVETREGPRKGIVFTNYNYRGEMTSGYQPRVPQVVETAGAPRVPRPTPPALSGGGGALSCLPCCGKQSHSPAPAPPTVVVVQQPGHPGYGPPVPAPPGHVMPPVHGAAPAYMGPGMPVHGNYGPLPPPPGPLSSFRPPPPPGGPGAMGTGLGGLVTGAAGGAGPAMATGLGGLVTGAAGALLARNEGNKASPQAAQPPNQPPNEPPKPYAEDHSSATSSSSSSHEDDDSHNK